MIKPYAHQRFSLRHGKKTPIVYDTSDAGTGKTAVRIWAFAERRAAGGGCMLVLCTKSNMDAVWAADFKKFAPHLKVSVAPADKREAAFAVDADVYVVNHDGVKWVAKQKAPFFKKFSEVVYDEIPAFKHHTSQRSRAALKITKYFKYRTGMTATPNSNTICDVFHQVLLLDDGQRLGKLFYQFRNSVAVPVQVGRNQHAIEWRDKDGAEEAVFGLLSDIVVRHKLDDCADIPQNHQYPLRFKLGASQQRAYAELEATSMLVFDVDAVTAKLSHKPTPVTAINAAAVATKLLQVASGAVYTAAGAYRLVDTARYELILDLVEQRKHPLVLFLWTHQRDHLVEEAAKRKLKYAVFDGGTSSADRERIVTGYQAGVYDVLFAHPKTVGHGLTLTRGTSTIWASPTYDLELFVQASSRQRRLGQTQKTETIVVLAEGTLDERVYDSMLVKDARMTNLLDLFSDVTKPTKPIKRRVAARTVP